MKRGAFMQVLFRFVACTIASIFGIIFASAQTPLPSPVVGSIPGSFDVTLSGSASYSIPIKIAPGAAGTEPKIQLVYDSQSLEGPLGAGWSLSGFSTITRGPKDQFTDNMIDGVRLEGSDALYLDGQRLIPVSMTGSGAARTIEFRKVIDDQTHVFQIGTDLNKSIFKAQTKGGLILIFDGTRNSNAILEDGTVLAFAESRVIDTAGNYIDFEYKINGLGECNLSSIKYTGHQKWDASGNVTADDRPFASVDFIYENAPRSLESFVSGRRFVRDQRLTSIISKVSDQRIGEAGRIATVVSRYELEYDDRNTANRFVFKALHQFGAGDNAPELQPISFTYSEPKIGWKIGPSFPSSAVLADRERLGAAYRFAHFAPGGNLPDMLFAAQIDGQLEAFAFRNDKDHWAELSGFKPPIAFTSDKGADLGVILQDVTGTGRIALLQNYQTGNQAPVKATYLPGNDKFELASAQWHLPFTVAKDGQVVAQYRFASWTGGPGPDLIYQSLSNQGFLKNTPSGWQPDDQYAPPIDIDGRFHVIDIDCSGKPALLGAKKNAHGHYEWHVFRFKPPGGLLSLFSPGKWDEELRTEFKPLFSADTDPEAIREIKFSSDINACQGLIVATGVGPIHKAYVTSRAGWKEVPEKTPQFDLVDANGVPSGAIVADISGDGLADVMTHRETSRGVFVKFTWLQTHSGWEQKLESTEPLFTPPLLSTLVADKPPISVFVGNLDGMGGADIVLPSDVRVLQGDPTGAFGQIFLGTSSGFQTAPNYAPQIAFARKDRQDRGVRLIDLHGTGLPDVIFSRDSGQTEHSAGAYTNTGNGWSPSVSGLEPPVAFASENITGNPVQFFDIDGDGFTDLFYSYKDKNGQITSHLYRNDAGDQGERRWTEVQNGSPLIPPVKDPASGTELPLSAYNVGDMGVRFLKLNKERLGMLVSFLPSMESNNNSPATKCTTTLPKTCELDRSKLRRAAFLFDGTKWVPAPNYLPPVPFVAQLNSAGEPSRDLFVQLIDVNGDGLPDIVARFKHPHDPTIEVHEVWLNTGDGWKLDTSFQVPILLDEPTRDPKALVQWADVNGDGKPDIVYTKRDGGSNLSKTWLGTGQGWVERPAWQVPLDAISDKGGDPSFRLVDVKGDGFLDVLYMRNKDDGTIDKGLFINNGSTWVRHQDPSMVPDLPFVDKDGSDQGVRLLSVTGRGLTDIVMSLSGKAPVVELSVAERSDILHKIIDGFGLETNIYYQTLLETDATNSGDPHPPSNLWTRVYERGLASPYPLIAPIPTSYVVRRAVVDEGSGRSVGFSYRYGDYRVDSLAMRSLGFGWRESLNEVTNILTRTELVQDAKLRNSTKREATCWLRIGEKPAGDFPTNLCPEGSPMWSSWAQKTSETQNFWAVAEGTVGGGNIPQHTLRQINLVKTKAASFELDGNKITGTTDTFEFDHPASILNRHSNVMKIHSEVDDGTFIETVNRYDQDDESRWFLGRLTEAVVTKVGDTLLQGSPARFTEIRKTVFEYNKATGLLSEEIRNSGHQLAVTTDYKRDTYGNIINTEVSAFAEKTQRTKAEYEPLGRFQIESQNSLGHRSTKTVLSTNGLPASITDPNGLTVKFVYDGFGRLRKETAPNDVVTDSDLLTPGQLSDTEALNGLIVSYVSLSHTDTLPGTLTLFDKKGRVLRTVTDGFTADGVTKRPIQIDTTYDLVGRIEKTSLPYERGQNIHWSLKRYDALGRAISATAPDGLITETRFSGLSTGGAKVTVVVDPLNLNRRSTSQINMRKLVVEVVDPMNGTVQYNYDAGGRVIKMIGPTGAETLHEYDELGNRIKTSDPDLGTWTYEYDAFGRIKQQTDANRRISRMSYDELGRPILRLYDDVTTTWHYDSSEHGLGKLYSVQNSNGYERDYYYDDFGRTSSVAVQIDKEQFTSSTSYDRLGRPENIFYPSGFVVQNIYDKKGFMVEVRNGIDSKALWKAKNIDVYGRSVEEVFGNGVSTTRAFEELNSRPKLISAKTNRGSVVLNMTLHYDRIGNLASRTETTDHRTRALLMTRWTGYARWR